MGVFKKNTPKKGRPDKTFTFKSFNEHISEIKIDLIRKIDTVADLEDDDGFESKFHATLQKFNDFNCTADFATLKKRLGGTSTFYSIIQVHDRREELAKILLNSLEKQDSLASDVTLELLVALVTDIGELFYPHFEATFNGLVKLLDTQDHRLIESIFMSLASFFKILSKCMASDVEKIFTMFNQLFSNKRPDYIRSFAAQSLTYLVRKVPEKEALVKTILDSVDADPGIITGASYLLFEIVKGVPGYLHSCADKFFKTLLASYVDNHPTSKNVKQCVDETFKLVAGHVEKERSAILWTNLLAISRSSIQLPQSFKAVASILVYFVSYKRGSLIMDPEEIVNFTIEMMTTLQVMDGDVHDCLDILLRLTAIILNNLYSSIESETRRKLIKFAFESKTTLSQCDSFIENLHPNRFFETEILPALLERSYHPLVQLETDPSKGFCEMAEILFKLIQCKKPLPVLETLTTFEAYPLNFSHVTNSEGCERLINRLVKVLIDPQDWNLVRTIVNILPHLLPLNRDLIISGLISLIYKIMAQLSEFNTEIQASLLQTVLTESIYSLCLLNSTELFTEFKNDFFFLLFAKYPGNPIILQGFVFFFQYAHLCDRKDVFSREFFETLFFDFFQENLRHPRSQVRFLTLIAINLFNPPLNPNESGQVNQSIFSICLESEMITLNIQEYREKIRLITLLQPGLVEKSLPCEALNGNKYDFAPIYYLLGTLYYNFQPLWVPVQKIIQNYGKLCAPKDRAKFWSIISAHFRDTQNYIQSEDQTGINSCWLRFNQTSEANPKPDHYNHRKLLLQILKAIATEKSNVVESNATDLVCWFFNFLENEADPKGLSALKREEDISLIPSAPDLGMEGEISKGDLMISENVDQEIVSDDELDKSETEPKVNKTDSKWIWKTLTSYLELLAHLKDPKKVDKEGKLLDLYHSLLQQASPEVQKAALNCILTYNDSNVMPYRESLLRLLDDSTFKTEILLFGSRSTDNSDEEEHVKVKHRPHVIPVVMRILYGKMLSKTGAKTAGKANIDVRRSIVFRFLATCSADEMMLFLKLSFADLVPFFDLEPEKVQLSLATLNLRACIPLKFIQSALKTLDLMLLHFGNVVSDLLPVLYKILLIITTLCRVLLDQRMVLNVPAVSRLKAIRLDCFKLTEKFFTLFEAYPHTPLEIDWLFESLINPMIINMANESLEAPSPILRLLSTWSQNPRYYILFVKTHPTAPEVTPLSCLIDLYSSIKASFSVIDYISTILSNLLLYANHSPLTGTDPDELTAPHLTVNGVSNESYSAMYQATSEEINFGTQILIPYISPILSRIKVNLSQRLAVKKGREVTIQENESIILFHLSERAEKEEDCLSLVNLLIDTINYRRDKFEESAIQGLESINKLIGKIKTNPKQFLVKLGRLFELIKDRNARLELCKILETISINVPPLAPLVDIIKLINSYNPKNPDEPDYTAREEGLSKARKIVQEMTESNVPVEWLKILIHNCVHFITTSEDLGLREVSSYCITLIVKQLTSFEGTKHFIDIVRKQIFLVHLKRGMKDPNELARHEWVTILAELVKHGKTRDKLLGQLSLLSHEDPDQDFWTNIRHIQIHRRIRALAKLSNNHELLSQFSPQLLHDFLLPVATVFISDLKETKFGAAQAYAVDLIGSICSHLPWPSYQRLLQFYLQRIISDADNHKSNVRILCSILTNFNYDLSKSKMAIKMKEERHISVSHQKQDHGESSDEPHISQYRQTLGPEAATRVHETIIGDLAPKLHQVLHKLSYTDYEYDNIKSEFNHEDEIQRMPIALALVKLLDSVPIAESDFEGQIRSIFTRMSTFLKSRMESIRESSRKTLCKIMEILGARYLLTLIREMKSILTKGFRFHVLTFTLYIVLAHMTSILEPGDLDGSAPLLIEIFHQELFTDVSEEKTVGKITSKCKEAKKVKSYAAYRILGKYVSSKNLIKYIVPLKKVLDEAYSVKVIKKVTICMEKFFLGLTENTHLTELSLVTFILNALEDKIPELKSSLPDPKNKKKVNGIPEKSDSLLLTPAYKQQRTTKTNPLSNVHVLFEYCLRLFLSLFKKNRIKPGTPVAEHLGSFVPILIDSLFSKHVRLTSTSLRCLNQYIRYFPTLPEFKETCSVLKDHVFVLLDEFVAMGSNSPENVELITMCFKTISSMVRCLETIKLDPNQLKVLLFYVDKDMADRSRQSTAFSLLKAILTKKMESPGLKDIMQKITFIMLQSEENHVREECRLVWLKYLLNYSLGGIHFTNHVTFFTRQLEYPREIGRSSILKLIFSLIKYQDNSQVSDNAASFYIPLAARLINDDSIKNRELAATVLEKLVSRISKKAREILFSDITLPWFQADNHLHRRLAAQLFGIFTSAEGSAFRSRLNHVLPLLVQQLDPTRFPLDVEEEETKRTNDHQLFHLLTLFHKLITTDPEIMEDTEHIENLNTILFHIESVFITYPHIWVRMLSVKIVASVFGHFPIAQLSDHLISGKSGPFYLLNNLPLRLWNLCKKHCFLFSIIYESDEIGDLLIKNLHHIARILLTLPQDFRLAETVSTENGNGANEEEEEPVKKRQRRIGKLTKRTICKKKEALKVIVSSPLSSMERQTETEKNKVEKLHITWLINRLIREIKREIMYHPQEYSARISIFKWIAAVVVEAEVTLIQVNSRNLLIPLAREITNRNLKEAGRLPEEAPKHILVNQCLQLYEVIRNKIGSDSFSKVYAEVVALHNRKKNERKAFQAVQFATNPVIALRRKQKKHQAWKESKKRKRDFHKGRVNKVFKKPKLS